MVEIGLAPDWHWIGTGLVSDWIGMGSRRQQFGPGFCIRLAQDWHRIWVDSQCIGNGLTDWSRIDI